MVEENQVRIFRSEDGVVHLEVSLDGKTVWLNQRQMAKLFDKDVRTINEHINNIYGEQELTRDPTIRKFRTVQKEGKREVTRDVEHYNLDVVISVGYRVKSQRGVQFRQWATNVLMQYVVRGYSLNEKCLIQKGVELKQVVSLLSNTLTNHQLINDHGHEVLKVVVDYARSWSLLQAYDEGSLAEVPGRQVAMRALILNEVLLTIQRLKSALMAKGEATALFGQLRGDGLHSAIATIEQSFDEKTLYPNVATRAAHLLYFVIKNHPFVDGNKRIGACLFLWYLRMNEFLLLKPASKMINDNTLVALALLVAESLPGQKELTIHLIEHFIEIKN